MAAKRSKGSDYAELDKLFSGIPEGHTTIDRAILDKLLEDKKRIMAINWDVVLDSFFKDFLVVSFSRYDKNVKKLFDPSIGGPLVSLTNKARLAYALGLIDQTTLNNLEHIHKIRNRFAHSTKASFADDKVVELVGKLSTAKGQNKVTANNSYKFFWNALKKCLQCSSQEIGRQVALLKTKKKSQKS